MKELYICLLLCSTISQLHAQWSNNTSENLLVANANSSDIQVANTNDGRTWIAFYSQRGTNYDMRAQLLDPKGNRLLRDSGILVSSKKSGSATFVFNVCVDHDNFLIVASQVQKGSDYESGLQRISTSGKLLWGDGVDLGPGLSPYPVALTTNEIAVAWNDNGKIDYQKISASGVAAWPKYKQFSGNTNHSVSRAQLIAGMNGKFSMVYQDLVSFPFYTNLFEQKFDNNGNTLWTSAVRISTITTASYRYFDVHADADTTYVGYYGNPSGSNRFDAYIQRINPDGDLPFGKNGGGFSDYSTNTDPFEQTIYIAKRAGAGDLWAVCTVTNFLQTTSTVYVQKINALNGKRYLGDNGKALFPLSSRLVSLAFSKLSLCDDSPMFLITDNSNKLAAVRLNSNGDFAWTRYLRLVGSSGNTKFRYGFTDVYGGQAVTVWQEDKGSGDMPYAQNITCSGRTGSISPQDNGTPEKNTVSDFIIKKIYPNPVQSVLTVTILSSRQMNSRIYISEVSGNVLKQFQQHINTGNTAVQLNVANLKPGTYFIKLVSEGESAVAIFAKE